MLAFRGSMHRLHSYAYVAPSYGTVVLMMFTFNKLLNVWVQPELIDVAISTTYM
jgi:hypothetical protein